MPVVKRSKTETTPPTVNHTPTADMLRGLFTDHFGEERIFVQPRQGMGAEDFAYFITPESGVKGVYFAIGGSEEDEYETAASHHSPFFKIVPEPAVTMGTEAMVIAAIELFNKE